MEVLYLLDGKKFSGSIRATVRNGFVDYSFDTVLQRNLTLDEYCGREKIKEPVLLDWENLKPIIKEWEEKNLITEFQEISEEKFFEMLEILPPLNFCNFQVGFLFFLRELTYGDISGCYVKFKDKYYYAQKRITETPESLLKEIVKKERLGNLY